uniref:ARAD1C41448p n=1 Tax=Blastobotrys adeninivorans TaxID=409370 RepID=A0A060T3P7_BLAAD
MSTGPQPSSDEGTQDLDSMRLESQQRLENAWLSIIEKYGDPSLEADIVDLETGEIVDDRGHLGSLEESETVWDISLGPSLELLQESEPPSTPIRHLQLDSDRDDQDDYSLIRSPHKVTPSNDIRKGQTTGRTQKNQPSRQKKAHTAPRSKKTSIGISPSKTLYTPTKARSTSSSPIKKSGSIPLASLDMGFFTPLPTLGSETAFSLVNARHSISAAEVKETECGTDGYKCGRPFCFKCIE